MKMEAEAGIEPASADLQSDAWPLCYPAISYRCAIIAKKNKSARYFFKYMGIYVFSCAVGTNKLSLYFIDQIKSVKLAQIFTNLDIQR